MTPNDLQTIERQAFRKSFDDGLFDVFLGLVLVLMPSNTAIDALGLSDTASFLATIALYCSVTGGMIWLRHTLMRQRLGTFKPSPHRMRRVKATRLALAASVAVALVAAAAATLEEVPSNILDWIPFIFLLNCVIVFGLMAYFLDVPRFLLYGFLFPAPVIARIWLPPYELAESFLAFGVPAAIIVGIGLFKLARFLRDYPLRAVEGSDVC